MNIGLVDVDGHNFPNFALMRFSACYKAKGHRVEWAAPRQRYDKVLASKVFTSRLIMTMTCWMWGKW